MFKSDYIGQLYVVREVQRYKKGTCIFVAMHLLMIRFPYADIAKHYYILP